MDRPEFIKHYSEIQQKDDSHYPGSSELLSVGSSFGRQFGLKRLGIHHEVLPPGRRTSWPHAESTEEEFIYVIEGSPDAWIDGKLHHLRAGDGIGFPAGTGISHTFLNNTETDVRLLVVGDSNREDDKIFYPLNPERKEQVPERWWQDAPRPKLGARSADVRTCKLSCEENGHLGGLAANELARLVPDFARRPGPTQDSALKSYFESHVWHGRVQQMEQSTGSEA